jgi:hypothetical protein
MAKGETGKKNLEKLVKERDEMRTEIIRLINDAKDLDPKDKKEQYNKASKLYTQLRKHESNKIKKNSHFNTAEGKAGMKRYTPAGDTQVLVDKKGKLKEDLFKILNEGTIFTGKAPGKSIRGKKDSGAGAGAETKEADDDGGSQESGTSAASGASGATAGTNVAEDPDFDELSPPKGDGAFGAKEDKPAQLQEEEVAPDGSAPPPAPLMTDKEMADSAKQMRDFLTGLTDEEVESASVAWEAGRASASQKDHNEKGAAAYKKMQDHLGKGWESVPREQLDIMFKYYYAEIHANDDIKVEASQPNEPDVNNEGAGATPQNAEEAFNMDDINNLVIDDAPPVVPPPDVSNDPAAQSTTYSDRTTQGDAPEFQQFNAPVPNVNIEVDDTTGGGLPPAGSGIPMSGAAPGMPQANMMTSSSLLNSMSFPTDAAQKLVEDRMRAKKSINGLKEEIRAMHLVYDDDIPSFKQQPHVGQKNDALKSNDIKVVRAHHKSMQDTIRNYYKTSDLKVGVILSAEGFFGGGAGMNPNLAALTQPRPPGELGAGGVRVSRPGHEFDNAIAGETRINRLGRNYKKPVSRNVPKVGVGTLASQVQAPTQVDDVERPLRKQRGFRSRRVNSNIPGMKVVIKTGKK